MDGLPERNHHDHTQNSVAECRPHHSLGQLQRRVFELLGHVRSGVRTNEAPNWCCQSYKAGEADRAPSAAIAAYCQSGYAYQETFEAYLKSVNTLDAGAWSAMIQRVKRKAKKPKMWTKSIMPSASGKCRAKKMLNPTVSKTNTKTISVVCHSAVTFASGYMRSTMS